jgi:hypothetical protein
VIDDNLKIMGAIGAFAVVVAIGWFLFSAYHSGDDMRCAQENVSRARDGVPRLNCD